MQNDDEVRDGTSSEPKIVRLGPRRATYTPPPRQPSAELHEDEELATALSAGLSWLGTGAIPTVPEQPAEPVEDAAAEVEDSPADSVETSAQEDASPSDPEPEFVASEPVVAEPVVAEPFAAEPAAEPVVSEPTSPWAPEFVAAPAPEPEESAGDAPDERPEPAPWESAPPPAADSLPYVPVDPNPEPVAAEDDAQSPEEAPAVPAPWESAPPPTTSAAPSLPYDEDDDGAVDDPAPEIVSSTEASSELPPWATLPAPDPAQAVYLPSGPDYSAPEEPEAPAAPSGGIPDTFVPEAWEPQPWEPDVASVDSSASLDDDTVDESPRVVFDLDAPVEDEPVSATVADAPAASEPPVAPEENSTEPALDIQTDSVSSEAVPAGSETSPVAAPVRQSLADDELASLVEDPAAREGGTLSLIEQFEQQLKLREQEAREFTEWESTMLALGTEDAVSEVESVRSQFTGVIPIIPSAPAAPEAAELVPEPEPEPEPERVPEPEQAPDDVAEPESGETPPPATEPDAAPSDSDESVVDVPETDAPAEDADASESEPAPFVAPAWPAWASAAAPILATDVVDEGSERDVTASEEDSSERADEANEADEADEATETANVIEDNKVETSEPSESAPETEPAAPTLPVWAVPAPTPGWVPPADEDDESADEAAVDIADVAEPVSETVPSDPDAESVVATTPDEAVEPDEVASDASMDAEPELVQPEPAEPEAAPSTEPTPAPGASDDDSAPWWLNEPVAEGIIAEPEPEPEPGPEPSVAEAETPTGVLEVVEPLVEPEILDPEEPAAEVLEGEVIDDEETPDEVEQGSVPPPFEPPALIEPPGYGAPVPAGDDQVTAFASVPGETGEVVVAEVLEAEPTSTDTEEDAPAAGFVFGADGSGARTAPAEAAPAFEDLLNGAVDEELPARFDPEPTSVEDAAAEPLFIEPMPVSAGEDVPTDTGSISILDRAYEEELDDDVDETDRAFGATLGGISVSAAGTTEVAPPFSPPSEPISIVRLRDDEVVIENNEPIRTPVFSIENSGPEPTPVDRRVGHAARLFWLWFAANSSVLSVALGAVIFGLGMSLRQSIVAVLIGVAISFIPLGLSSLAGKRSGQPTMIVSRATFGVVGNIVPAAIALLTRLFWGAVLLWLLASSVAIVLGGADSAGALGDRQIQLISLAAAFVVALLVAFAGYPLLARMQLILSIVSGVMIFGLVLLTVQHVDFAAALDTADGSWLLVVSGAVLVFSFVGLVWANSGGDLARYQRPATSGASSMLWSTFGATLPAFLLIGYGALLAASDRGIAEGFATEPLETLAGMLPGWYPIPLLAATALSLLSGVVLSLYSGGFALQAVGVRLTRSWSTIVVGVLTAVLALVLTVSVTGGMTDLFRDLATTIAVPTAAWAGIFAAEIMIRNRRYDSDALLSRGGIYGDVRWVNLVGLVVISVLGWGLTTASVAWLGWQGYLFGLFGAPLDGDLASTDLGVLVALGLGLLLPIVAGIPAIRRQEEIRV